MRAIETVNLCKQYGNNPAITNLNIEIQRGEIFTILGANGAGKTTTINVLTTLLKPTSGEAFILEREIQKETNTIRKLISLMPQGSALDPFLSVYDNLRFYAKLVNLDKGVWIKKAESILEDLDLTDRKNYPIMALSGGQFRRAQIARILLSTAPIIFLDEPTLGIDIEGKLKIWELIKRYRNLNGWTVILSTNDMAEAEELSDRILFLFNGSVYKTGTPKELKEQIQGKLLKIKFYNSISNINSIQGYETSLIDNSTLLITSNNNNNDLRPVLQMASELGSIKSVVTDNPSLTDVFRKIRNESTC